MFTMRLSTLICTLFLSPFAIASNADLKLYIQSQKAQPSTAVDPVPQQQASKPYIYTASDRRSPFDSGANLTAENLSPQDPCTGADCSQQPVAGRTKQMLEYFALNSMAMVGTIERQPGNSYALVAAPDGVISRIKVGDYIGQSEGLITEITADHIRIRELVKVGDNRWLARHQVLNLRSH